MIFGTESIFEDISKKIEKEETRNTNIIFDVHNNPINNNENEIEDEDEKEKKEETPKIEDKGVIDIEKEKEKENEMQIEEDDIKDNNDDKKESEEVIMMEEENDKNDRNDKNDKENDVNFFNNNIINVEHDDKMGSKEEIQNNTNNNVNNNNNENNDKNKNESNEKTNNENNEKTNNENNEKTNNEDNESKKEQKSKKRVRGPNKCYRIIEEFFRDNKRKKEDSNVKASEEALNEEEKKTEENKKKPKKRAKINDMTEIFDEFLNFVNEKVNKKYYDVFIYPIINNYKEFYIEKEKEFKNKSINLNSDDENHINNVIDENLAKRKKSYGLKNFLEISEIVNEYVKYIYDKNIFVTDESKIEMIEIIFVFCTWLKQNHYSSYSIEYLIK